ncbi:MAG TPA: hypothetical protein VK806_00195 [Bacteroidia bacterium]|jgi:hypothetical protein|nr:hypothetical protein [Bacteroidia bacterium]
MDISQLQVMIGADTSQFDDAMKAIPAKFSVITNATNQLTTANVNLLAATANIGKALKDQGNAATISADLMNKAQGDMQNAFAAIGESLGKTATGQKNPFAPMLKMLQAAIKQLAGFLLKLGTPMLFTPATAAEGALYIGEGIALEAVSAAMGIIKMASGGIVSGSTFANIGEYAGASHNPEVVAPLDKLKNMMGNNGPGGHYSFEIQGDRMVAMLQRQSDNTNFALGGQ